MRILALMALVTFCCSTMIAQAETLNVSVTGQGTTSPEAGLHTYSSGETVFLSAFASFGWRFNHWEGDLSGTSSSLVPLVMDSDKSVTAVFTELVSRTLTITISGNGTTNPTPGIHSCQDGQAVMISATPGPGYAFDHWEGGLSGSNAYNQMLVMDGDKSVTAVFVPQDVTLTISITGYGATLPPVGVTGFLSGQTATLQAISLSMDWHFDHWEGDVTGSTNPETLAMDDNKIVTAVFTTSALSFSLTTLVTGNGAVEPAGTTSYPPGTVVPLAATPDPGWEFVEWQGSLSGSENPTSVTMYSNKSIRAVFQEIPDSYILVTSPVGNGTINPSGTNTYPPGTVVDISAIPDPGWEFVEWQGSLTGSENPTNITMNADKNVYALFAELTSHILTMAMVGNGTVSPAVGEHLYPGNQPVEISATPETGWHFIQWEGDYTGTENPVTITMNADKSITAVFAANEYTLTTDAIGKGTVEPAGTTPHLYGEEVQITATPDTGWRFWEWQGDLTGGGNPVTLLIDGNKTVTAVFMALSTYTLTMSVIGSGITSPESGAHDYLQGTEVPISATPNTGWVFDHWEQSITGNENPTSITMNTHKAVTAIFVAIDYSLTTNVIGNGTVNPAGTTTHPYASQVSLTATPAAGWNFQEWQGDLTGATNPTQILIDGDKTVTALFVEKSEGEGTAEGEGGPEGPIEGQAEGAIEGAMEGEGVAEGQSEGAMEGEGQAEGVMEGEGGAEIHHTSDQNGDGLISLSELLRVIQFFNSNGLHCEAGTEDGYAPGAGDQGCAPHDSDYAPQDWAIGLSELLRVIQFFNSGGYHACSGTEDGFCPGP